MTRFEEMIRELSVPMRDPLMVVEYRSREGWKTLLTSDDYDEWYPFANEAGKRYRTARVRVIDTRSIRT